ncbi:MAG: DUF488 domain-containing protein [Pseudomonadota bacterium]
MQPRVVTIGYERATQAEVVARLADAGVARLIDVRAVAASRRAGFSKTLLAAGLAEAGIAYTHLRALGTPKEGREAARRGDHAALGTIYGAALETPEAVDAFALLQAMVGAECCALLCYEADAAGCHRRILTDRLAARLGAEIVDL